MLRHRKLFVLTFTVLAPMAAPASAIAQQNAVRCADPAAEAGGPSNADSRHVEANLLPAIVEAGTKPFTLKERMRAYDVPGVSVAVIHGGKIAWSRGWGVRDAQTCAPVTPRTAFQAASISKAVTALVALRLVEQGKLGLDRDINDHLMRWKLPRHGKLASGGATLRQLLSHTAGTNVHGFPGYRAGAPLPTLSQILEGAPPSATEAVRTVMEPGAQWQYSGGGYVAVQAAIEDATGKPFAALATREIFRPLGMKRSAFSQPPSATMLADSASGHSGGKIIPGRWHVYPELAPAGLWTTASDLARLILDIQASAAGQRGRRLSPGMTRQMLTPLKGSWGLGPALHGSGPQQRFGHDGVNEGFQSTMLAYAEKGEGVVVLTNGDQGKRLADEIVRAVATHYGWSELASAPIVEAALPPEALSRLVGRYEGGGLSVFLDLREGRLYAQTGGPNPERLVALSPSRFRTEVSGILVEFDQGADGAIRGFRILEGAPPLTLARIEAAETLAQGAPLFLRGSMNDWLTSIPLVPGEGGILAAEVPLEPGDYQFKIGSANWRDADFGASGATSIVDEVEAQTLVPHGGNVRLTVRRPGRYRFALQTSDGRTSLAITRVADR